MVRRRKRGSPSFTEANMLNKTGVPTPEMVASKFPGEEKLNRPKAIIECYEEIPCNPCSTSCPVDAIVIDDGMNAIPRLIVDKCTGCGQCVVACPGLAITVAQILGNKALFKIPYEFTPYPQKGEIWHGLNRNGDVMCDAEIKSVLLMKNSKTALVTVIIDKAYLHDFVTIKQYGR